MDWPLGCMFLMSSVRLVVTGGETLGLSAVRDIFGELLANVVVESVGCVPVDLVFVLLLTASSSSSDDISTTVWADITRCKALAGLAISNL